MPNGKRTTRDYVIEIHTDVKHIKEWKKSHERYHRFIWVSLIALPAGIYYLIQLIKGV